MNGNVRPMEKIPSCSPFEHVAEECAAKQVRKHPLYRVCRIVSKRHIQWRRTLPAETTPRNTTFRGTARAPSQHLLSSILRGGWLCSICGLYMVNPKRPLSTCMDAPQDIRVFSECHQDLSLYPRDTHGNLGKDSTLTRREGKRKAEYVAVAQKLMPHCFKSPRPAAQTSACQTRHIASTAITKNVSNTSRKKIK